MDKDRFGFSPSDGDDHISVRGSSGVNKNIIIVGIVVGVLFLALYRVMG